VYIYTTKYQENHKWEQCDFDKFY